VIATHGRSFYVLDNIALLRQLEPSITASAVHVFKPGDAVKPRRPAAIDYYLAKPADQVTIDILDGAGQVVRTIKSSEEEDKKLKKSQDEDTDFGPPPNPPPGRKAGSNRYVWDLRYPGATVFEGEIMWGARAQQGPLAVPGAYQVRITAAGQSQTQAFTLKLDEREHVTDAQLQEQFKLASQIRDQVSRADEMVIAIRRIVKDSKDRAEKAKDEEVTSVGAELRDKLSTIEEEIYQVRNRANEDPLNFPIKLNNQIAALARSVETGDNPPTQQDYEIFQILTARLAAVQAKYDGAMQKDLAHFNEVLAAHKQAAIRSAGSPLN